MHNICVHCVVIGNKVYSCSCYRSFQQLLQIRNSQEAADGRDVTKQEAFVPATREQDHNETHSDKKELPAPHLTFPLS